MAKPSVDKELCIGCGSCISVCPECFELDDEGKSSVIAETCDCDLEEIVLGCPVQAITVEDKEEK
jgi:ferredoxin